MLQVSRQSVYNWIGAYCDAHDPADLVDAAHVGRPHLLDEDGESCSTSAGLLAAGLWILRHKLDGPVAPRALTAHDGAASLGRYPSAMALTAWGTNGSVPVTSWPPIRSAKKNRRICREILALPRRSVVLAEDETDLLLFPHAREAWWPRGRCRGVPERLERLPGGLRSHELRTTGNRLFLTRQKHRAEDFRGFLGLIPRSLPGMARCVAVGRGSQPHCTGLEVVGRENEDDPAVTAEAGGELKSDGHALGPRQGSGRRE